MELSEGVIHALGRRAGGTREKQLCRLDLGGVIDICQEKMGQKYGCQIKFRTLN